MHCGFHSRLQVAPDLVEGLGFVHVEHAELPRGGAAEVPNGAANEAVVSMRVCA